MVVDQSIGLLSLAIAIEEALRGAIPCVSGSLVEGKKGSGAVLKSS